MKAIYLLITNGILSIVSSQQSYGSLGPIDLSSWTDDTNLSPQPFSRDCRQIGTYDEANGVVKMFGGDGAASSPSGYYEFNTTSREYTFINTTRLSMDISVQATGWMPDGDIIYYENTDSGIIRQININTLEDTIFATLTESQPGPGLCVNKSSGTVYSVGNSNIEACNSDGTCTITHENIPEFIKFIDGINQPTQEIACAVFGDTIYTFGGYVPPTPFVLDNVFPYNDIMRCPLGQNCTALDETLDQRLYGIRVLCLPCFGDQYVVLIGGAATSNNVVSDISLFNMETEDYNIRPPAELEGSVRGPVAVYDTARDEIWTFGGIDTRGGASCGNEIQFSVSPVCYTLNPTMDPTMDPTSDPTADPTADPTDDPTSDPTTDPTNDPTFEPTVDPTDMPTEEPTTASPVTAQPTADPASTDEPTKRPTTTTTYEPITEGYTTSSSAYGVVIGLLIAICCIIAICAFWYSKEEKDHVYGRMEQGAVAVVAGGGGGAVPMVAAGAGYGGYEQPKAAAAGGYDNGTAATGYTQSTDQKY